jgi:hypothetical protein
MFISKLIHFAANEIEQVKDSIYGRRLEMKGK